ncbi:MAG: 16S rRNA (guanine(966)-N(2))-methyltransferase RsmD [Chitinophagaceae bacterium]
MRIISGTHGGRKIHPPSQMPKTRPTTDIAKEGLFNTLQNQFDFEGISTLDLFGGTGSISYELASRGATYCNIVEQDKKMYEFIKNNIQTLSFENQCHVIKMDVFKYILQCKDQYDFIFAGPPYALKEIDTIPDLIFEKNILKDGGIFILEHTPRNNYEKHRCFSKSKHYGTTIFSFFSPKLT